MFFAIVVASAVIIATGVIIGGWDSVYQSGINYDLEQYEQLDEFKTEAGIQEDKVTPKDDDTGTGDFEGKVVGGGFGIIGRIFAPYNTIRNMLVNVGNDLGLPYYVTDTIFTLMVFAIIFSVVAIIFRLSRSSA